MPHRVFTSIASKVPLNRPFYTAFDCKRRELYIAECVNGSVRLTALSFAKSGAIVHRSGKPSSVPSPFPTFGLVHGLSECGVLAFHPVSDLLFLSFHDKFRVLKPDLDEEHEIPDHPVA